MDMGNRDRGVGRAVLLAGLMAVTVGCASDGSQNEDKAAALYDEFPPGEPQRCINIRNVRSMEPVGDHTLLFYMRNDEVWRNRLDQALPGHAPRHGVRLTLAPGTSSRPIDIVYQLERLGNHFRRGIGCALGEFDYLTEDQAEAVKQFR
ncbi:MAG: hypothetical protein U5R48_14370 [Gammaproteobacteria bacterium]|nr:hypothetical protein [Gammaproteobacteria bacterium]